MTSARSIAVILVAVLAPAGASAACPPSARVTGDEAIATPVRFELAVLGVRTAAIPPPCPAVDVTVSAAGEQVSVALRDPSGRRAGQLVTNARVAATWIESWLHPELRAPLLGPRGGEAARGGEVARTAVKTTAYRGFTVGAAGEKVYASDDSEWRSLAVAACARWGSLCPGLVARLADNRDFSPAEGGNQLDRLAVDLVASLSARLDTGRMTISPGIAIGLGYLRTATDPCENTPDDAGVVCEEKIASSATIGPRGEMALAAEFPIAGGVSLVIAGSLGFAPMARGQPNPVYDPDGQTPGEPGPDGTVTPPDEGDPAVSEPPGEPNHFTRIGVGLAVELD